MTEKNTDPAKGWVRLGDIPRTGRSQNGWGECIYCGTKVRTLMAGRCAVRVSRQRLPRGKHL